MTMGILEYKVQGSKPMVFQKYIIMAQVGNIVQLLQNLKMEMYQLLEEPHPTGIIIMKMLGEWEIIKDYCIWKIDNTIRVIPFNDALYRVKL